MAFTSETVVQIWDDKDSTRIDVGPDRDGLDLVEIRQYDAQGVIASRITMPREQAVLVAKAIDKLYISA
jgi:hypothetical protein